MSCHKDAAMDTDTAMMLPAESDDWEVLKSFLPEGWQGQAKKSGAFQRSREAPDSVGGSATFLRPVRESSAVGPRRSVWECCTGANSSHLSFRGPQLGRGICLVSVVHRRGLPKGMKR